MNRNFKEFTDATSEGAERMLIKFLDYTKLGRIVNSVLQKPESGFSMTMIR